MAKTFPTQVRRALVGGKLDDSVSLSIAEEKLCRSDIATGDGLYLMSAVHLFTPQAHASHPGLNNRQVSNATSQILLCYCIFTVQQENEILTNGSPWEAAVSKSHGCNNRIFIEDLSVKESVQSRVPHDEEVPMMHLWSNYTPVPKAQRRP
ncbi:hypothetical protein PCH_Pc24g00810 [Penicillium rubens Wisconsin 54-1255]|uniref:Uncharacterized protein n=1 Tax=Penicillium rubens (strain ATCC 28089 / DSM 1075 / NRRL 1951 / Wisconsin 54-1255) TaxID=500485 RepID=B6HWN9_PENRW|nr:hypothetical protein PCH_Pc24g00810 [Penicillium rubens Wisconsin 54-1255]